MVGLQNQKALTPTVMQVCKGMKARLRKRGEASILAGVQEELKGGEGEEGALDLPLNTKCDFKPV